MGSLTLAQVNQALGAISFALSAAYVAWKWYFDHKDRQNKKKD